MNKKLALILSILITLVGTVLLYVYDYNIYYNPEHKNAEELTSEYKSYLVNKTFKIEDEAIKQTEAKIELNEKFSTDYYSETPIVDEEVLGKNNQKLYKIKIYRDVVKYNPNVDTVEYKFRYNTYIYDVDYDAIKQLFKNQDLPQDKEIIENAGMPIFYVNFYPNSEINDEESFYYKPTSEIDNITLNNGEKINRVQMNSLPSITLYDYTSNPSTDKNNTPYNVKYLSLSAYPTYSDNYDLFNDGGVIKIDLVAKTTDGRNTVNYLLEEDQYIYEKEIKEFDFFEEIKFEDYKVGYNTSSSVRDVLNNVDIEGVKGYDAWIFGKYIWWQCLICLVVLGAIVGGFFYALTVDTTNKKNIKKIKTAKK